MIAAGTTATMDSHAIHPHAAQPGTIWAQERLPWPLATPLIGVLSFGLWLGIWQLARLALGG